MKNRKFFTNTKSAWSEWKRTGSLFGLLSICLCEKTEILTFHAIFQEVNDKKLNEGNASSESRSEETLFLGKNNEEKYRRYFA